MCVLYVCVNGLTHTHSLQVYACFETNNCTEKMSGFFTALKNQHIKNEKSG